MIDISKRILITGASGYIGSCLLKKIIYLWAQDVYVSVHKNKTFPSVWIKTYKCNIACQNEVEKMINTIRPEIIFHFAALGTKNSQTKNSLEELIAVNGLWTIHLINAAKKIWTCIWFLNFSSAYEYGSSEFVINEKSNLAPSGNYALSKSLSSLYAMDQAKTYWFPVVTYRAFSVYGPWDKWRIIPLILEAFFNKKNLKLFNIYQKRNFVHIENVISSILEFDKVIKKNINILNIAGDEDITIYDLVRKIEKIALRTMPNTITFDEDRNVYSHWGSDNTLLKNTLSIPMISLSKWIKWIIRLYNNSN